MKRNYASLLRIYPNKEQQTLIDKTIGCCRFLYNQMLAEPVGYDSCEVSKEQVVLALKP